MDLHKIHFVDRFPHFLRILLQAPSAAAEIDGSSEYPEITGQVWFYQTAYGVLVAAQIFGLPTSDVRCDKRIFAFHIHSGDSCTGTREDPFANAMMHYNPDNCDHPSHAGDLPPLFGSNGFAFTVFLTDRFTVNEIIGKTVIVHQNPDDFTSQPSGSAGKKIACGEIRRSATKNVSSYR